MKYAIFTSSGMYKHNIELCEDIDEMMDTLNTEHEDHELTWDKKTIRRFLSEMDVGDDLFVESNICWSTIKKMKPKGELLIKYFKARDGIIEAHDDILDFEKGADIEPSNVAKRMRYCLDRLDEIREALGWPDIQYDDWQIFENEWENE